VGWEGYFWWLTTGFQPHCAGTPAGLLSYASCTGSLFVLKFACKEKAISVFRNSPACPDLGTLLLLLGRLLSKEAVVHKMRGADHPADRHPKLAEISLQLLTRRGLVADGGLTALPQRLPPSLYPTLHSAQAHLDALLFPQLLPHHLSVAVVLLKLLLQPVPVTIQLAGAVGAAVGLPLAESEITMQCVARDSKLRCNPPAAPTPLQQLPHHHHLLRRLQRTLQPDQPRGAQPRRWHPLGPPYPLQGGSCGLWLTCF